MIKEQKEDRARRFQWGPGDLVIIPPEQDPKRRADKAPAEPPVNDATTNEPGTGKPDKGD